MSCPSNLLAAGILMQCFATCMSSPTPSCQDCPNSCWLVAIPSSYQKLQPCPYPIHPSKVVALWSARASIVALDWPSKAKIVHNIRNTFVLPPAVLAVHCKHMHHKSYLSISQTTCKSMLSTLHRQKLSHHCKGSVHSYVKLCTNI